jgi:hypothetical protein
MVALNLGNLGFDFRVIGVVRVIPDEMFDA